MIDAHAHLLGRTDVARALELAADAGVTRVILGGTWPADDVAARALAARFPQVSWTSGVHPWWVPADPVDRTRAIEAVAAAFDAEEAPHPVALGEIGLDALRGPPRADQIAALRAQLALARARDLPVVLHVVRAHGPALELLERDGLPAAGGVVHGFTGAAELALRYVRLGLHIGLGPHLLRDAARTLHGAALALPADRLLVETDSPDQAAGPAEVRRVVTRLADLRGEQRAAVARYTAENATRLFGLSPGARRPA